MNRKERRQQARRRARRKTTIHRGLIIENNDPRQSQVEIWIEAAVRNG